MDIVPLTPITVVKVLKGVPFDSTYRDARDWETAGEQQAYFMSKAKYTYSDLTPVRLQNKLRLPVNADSLYDCNYIMFQNANFGSRWFYCFITEINFINVNVSEIAFEIDVLNTWWFDFSIRPSFVEREHIERDHIGDNLVPENLELGEYILSHHEKAGVSNDYCVLIASTVDETGADVQGGYYGGVYSGVKMIKCTGEEANNYIANLTRLNKSDAIVSICMASDTFTTDINQPPATQEIRIDKRIAGIDGYQPVNNKLYTYPYNFMYCINTMGATAEFKYEYFNGSNCRFGLIGETSCNPQVTLIPYDYKIDSLGNLNEKMVLSGFPQCAYNIDSYKAWLAQNGSSTAINVLSSAAGVATGIASAPATGGLGFVATAQGVAGIASTMAQIHAISAKPPQANGSAGTGNTFAYGQLDFHFYNAHITADFARQIDDYFTMFGYAVHKVKMPNFRGRPSFNYVKTRDICLVGSVPFDDMAKIKSIFDKGVTFWHGDFVGDYARDNKPVN